MKSIVFLTALVLSAVLSGAQDLPPESQSQTEIQAAAPDGIITGDVKTVTDQENAETPPLPPSEQVSPPVPEQNAEPVQEKPQEKSD